MKILVTTSEFFEVEREFRLDFIANSFQSISQIKSDYTKIVIHCNNITDDYLDTIKSKLSHIPLDIEFVRVDINGYALAWEHKKLLEYFIESDFDYFLYYENDLKFQQKHLDYYIKTKKFFKENNYNFLPSFIRYEVDADDNLIAVDCSTHISISNSTIVSIGGKKFISQYQPYQGLEIFDKEDAIEHINSDWVKFETSRFKVNCGFEYGLPESANIGNLYVNVPNYFNHRGLLPLDSFEECLIHHIPNKFIYSNIDFGKIPINKLLIP